MKTFLRLAVLVLAGTGALALAGNALATQKLSVRQTATSMTIKVSQAQTDPQPLRITIYVPSGYSINASATAGTKIGTTTGTVFARDANIPLPLSGDVVAVPPTTNAPGCDPVPHIAVWNLALAVANNNINLPVHVDQLSGAEAALGSYKLVVCLAPDDVPVGTPGRSPNGARLLDATFTVDNVFTIAPGDTVWKAITTPWAGGAPNAAGTVETRALVSNGAITLNAKVTNKGERIVRASGKVTQAGAAAAGAQVSLLLNGKSRFRIRSSAAGAYSIVLRKSGKKTTTTFQARTTVAERDATTTGCASPSLPNVPCVNATISGFTAVSRKIRIKI
ncbi:MAG: hypothetical protein E6G33_03720 [Actinobacteria bacterium]|nr:MAG: hypothetical protein E6G33_03720 [Actinomycetota bacterium]